MGIIRTVHRSVRRCLRGQSPGRPRVETLEPRLCLTVATVGTAAGVIDYQYPLAGGGVSQVPLADWAVYDDVADTGSFAPGDPVAFTNLAGQFTIGLASESETIRVLPRPGWGAADGVTAAAVASPGGVVPAFYQSMTDPTVIDVQAAYTSAAQQAYGPSGGDITGTIGNLFAYANQVQADSDSNIRLNLVGLIQTNYGESGSFNADLQAAAAGTIADVTAARKADGADLTVLFEGDADNTGRGEIGLAYEFARSHPDPAEGDAIIGLLGNPARDGVTLAHEIGHTLGADHDPAHASAADTEPYARGYEFVGNDGTAYQDVMSYGTGTFLPYYSTPAAFYAGHALGLTSNGDNARAIRQDGPVVARYVTNGDEGPTAAASAAADPIVLTQTLSVRIKGSSVLGGTRGTARVALASVGTAPATGTETITLSLTDAAADDVALATVAVPVRLPTGRSKTVALAFTWPADLPTGSDQLLATAADGATFAITNDGTGFSTAATINYRQPTVDLSATAASSATLRGRAGRGVTIPLRLKNLGNAPAAGSVSFSISLSPVGLVEEFVLPSIQRKISVPAGRTASVRLSVPLPASLMPGQYMVAIDVAPATAPTDSDLNDKLIEFTLTVV
jgi:hypothetical protein